MPTNTPGEAPSRQQASKHVVYIPGKNAAQRPAILFREGKPVNSGQSAVSIAVQPPQPAHPSSKRVSWQAEQRDLQLWFLLLIVVCLASLGSLSLTPRPSASTTVSQTLTGGECSADPDDVIYGYTYPLQDNTATVTFLPDAWFTAGHTKEDYAYAQACAASFVSTYLTIDTNNQQSFTASTSMLTAGAQARFYGRVSGVAADNRANPLWQAAVQRQHLRQLAQVARPKLLQTRYQQKTLYVWLEVPCQLTITLGSQSMTQTPFYTVLLIDVPPHVTHKGTGWQVSAWEQGSVVFNPPTPL